MDRDRCTQILKGYGAGDKALRLICNSWDDASLVCRAQGRNGRVFKAGRGVTQKGPLSPKFFNVMIDAIVREWLRQVVGEEYVLPEVEIDGIVRLFTALFYEDDGYIASTDAELLQRAVDVLTGLFDRVGLKLKTNVSKTKVMTCVDARIRVRQSDEVYYNSRHGFRSAKDWNRRQVECDKCGLILSAASLNSHLETQHGVFRSKVLNRDFLLNDGEPETYTAQKFFLPSASVPDATDSFHSAWGLHRHFRDRHPRDYVDVEGSGGFPMCQLCIICRLTHGGLPRPSTRGRVLSGGEGKDCAN